MFHFSEPRFLWLLVLIPPVLWLWTRHRRGSARHPQIALFPITTTRRTYLAQWGGLILRGLALISLVIAIAGPRWPDLRTRIITEGIAITMAVDVSSSMQTKDYYLKGEKVSRLDAAKYAFRVFIEGGEHGQGPELRGRRTDLIGLIHFAQRPDVGSPLTLSHSALLNYLQAQQPMTIPGESQTNVIDGLASSLNQLATAGERRKVLVLLTDGEDNVPKSISGWTVDTTIQVAKGLGVPIYVIDAGAEPPPPPREELDEDRVKREQTEREREQVKGTLRRYAEETGGKYFRVTNTEKLLQTYLVIDQKEREPIVSFQYRRYHEGYPWFALAALVLYQMALIMEMTLWRRIP